MLPLIEFSKSRNFELSFDHSLEKNILTLHFKIKGDLSSLYPGKLPEIKLKKASRLWEKTCFEAFFFEEKSTAYTELNFNVFGEYAFLYFESYRVAKTKPTSSYECLDIQRKESEEFLTLMSVIKVPQAQKLKLSPTALLMPKNSKTLYFALSHGQKPDFHSGQAIENKAFQVLT